ncbi:MAG: DUF302 domain-containing protein [Gammaproteobacteria bacterium]|nr:DUF302 domain-containing protein [Gammaproteobacteria bacterium]
MKKIMSMFLLVSLSLPMAVIAGEKGMITKASPYSVTETLDRLESTLKSKGVTIALRWSHSDKAEGVGIPLRPTELLIFGNPKLGSHMFTSKQTAGIDFPMKALAWKDEKGQVWLTYNDPSYMAKRHKIKDRDDVIKKMTGALDKFTDAAIAK